MTNAHLQHCLTRLRETRTLLDQIETDLRAALTPGPNVINIEGPAADSWQLVLRAVVTGRARLACALRRARLEVDDLRRVRPGREAGPNVINIEGPAADSWQLGVGRIDLWRWTDAPPAYRALSTHGEDEDFVAFVPASVARNVVVDHLLAGRGAVYEYEVAGGTVLIGAGQ